MIPKYRVGLIGHNISYSKSGDIFAAIFRQLGVEGDFRLLDIASGELDAAVYQLRRESYSGVAVTIPHKQAMLSYLDRKSDAVTTIGATNSIGVKQSSLVGHNTDGDGFAYSLEELAGVTSVKRALIIGNGGSARAVVYSLANAFGCREFVVFGRTTISLATFQNDFLTRITDAKFRLCATDDGLPSGSPIDLVVNCTPLGGWHHPDADPIPRDLALSQSTVYVDLNYNDNNSVVSRARSAGAIALNGAPMLVAQAIKSFELWTGKRVAFEPIFSSVFPDQKLPGETQR